MTLGAVVFVAALLLMMFLIFRELRLGDNDESYINEEWLTSVSDGFVKDPDSPGRFQFTINSRVWVEVSPGKHKWSTGWSYTVFYRNGDNDVVLVHPRQVRTRWGLRAILDSYVESWPEGVELFREGGK